MPNFFDNHKTTLKTLIIFCLGVAVGGYSLNWFETPAPTPTPKEKVNYSTDSKNTYQPIARYTKHDTDKENNDYNYDDTEDYNNDIDSDDTFNDDLHDSSISSFDTSDDIDLDDDTTYELDSDLDSDTDSTSNYDYSSYHDTYTPNYSYSSPSYPQHSDVYVHSYVRRDGTYVQGHYRTAPNNTTVDNYSHKGNVNPYTGKRGYKEDW